MAAASRGRMPRQAARSSRSRCRWRRPMPTLLVVDDEAAILLAFRRAFRDTVYQVVTAETAADGLTQARDHRPDVAVLDVQLPDGSGLELFSRLRALDARMPVIFITGKATADTAIKA